MGSIARHSLMFCALAILVGTVYPCVCAKDSQPAGDQLAKLPPFEKFERLAREHFRAAKLAPRQLISQGDVRPLFALFEKHGWKIADQQEILTQVLPDNDFMVQQLRRPDAGNFVAHISRDPQGYDRTDRLRRLPRGEIFLSDLVGNPGGYQLIDYMTTSPYGQNLGNMIAQGPNGKDFNKPTGRLYTSSQLLTRLKESYHHAMSPPTRATVRTR